MATRMWQVVDAPANRPPRGATLLRSAALVPEADEEWMAGLRYQPEACGEIGARAAGLCGSGFQGWPDVDDLPDVLDYVPPFVAVGRQCPTLSGYQFDEIADQARRLLDQCETVGIARELWRGDVARAAAPDLPNNYLTQAASLDELNGSASTPAVEAFAWLEQAIATCSCGGVGMIHAAPFTATIWSEIGLVERQADGRLLSSLGTIVVADPGYDGSAPDLTTDATWATAWAYGTTMVDVRRGAVATAGERSFAGLSGDNQNTAWAYRPFAATFDPCCHVGIKVNHADRD